MLRILLSCAAALIATQGHIAEAVRLAGPRGAEDNNSEYAQVNVETENGKDGEPCFGYSANGVNWCNYNK